MHCITKVYRDIPFAHRQQNHDGHCQFIHGHNWSFEFTITAVARDECGFVIDFGKMNFVKKFLAQFDHALVLSISDPHKLWIKGQQQLFQIVEVPDSSCEGLAEYCYREIAHEIDQVDDFHQRGVHLLSVTVHEDERNSATFQP